MKTKNIFKTLAFAMLMPTMLLTTACSSEDDLVNDTAGESTANTKGYALPVTINVTRQGDAATRASYNESTRMLSFSAGDKLFVSGSYDGMNTFAGMLDYVSDGKFSGTIMTQTEWTGTIEELLSADGGANATLLPAGYGEYGYLSIADEGTYEALLSENSNKAFATSKATAVEQFSYEYDNKYSSGFELTPANAILNFTITGLTASTEVDVSFSYSYYPEDIVVSGKVTTDGDGTATFAIGIKYGNNLKDCTLTVGGNAITLVSSKTLEAGKIYNITRAVTPPTLAQTMNTAGITVKVKYNYENDVNYCLFSSVGDGTYTFQSGDGWAGSDNDKAKALVVEDGKLVFKQNVYDTIDDQWSNYGFSVTFDTSKNTYSNWVGEEVQSHNPSFISVEVNSVPIALKITVANLVKEQGQSWSAIIANNSDKIKADGDYVVRISDNAKLQYNPFGGDYWQDVRYSDSYQTMYPYKFEGD